MTILAIERTRLLLAIAVVVPSGFLVKFGVPGCLGPWCNRYGGAVLYEVFWILMLRLVTPRLSPFRCGAVVFAVTCVLEFMQLWHPPILEETRRTVIGAALIGTTFDPWDFAYYAAGSGLGVALALAAGRGSDR
jgi:hypothetical protein